MVCWTVDVCFWFAMQQCCDGTSMGDTKVTVYLQSLCGSLIFLFSYAWRGDVWNSIWLSSTVVYSTTIVVENPSGVKACISACSCRLTNFSNAIGSGHPVSNLDVTYVSTRT